MSAADAAHRDPSDSAANRREAKRRAMMAKVPAGYSGRAHGSFINLITLVAIGPALGTLLPPGHAGSDAA